MISVNILYSDSLKSSTAPVALDTKNKKLSNIMEKGNSSTPINSIFDVLENQINQTNLQFKESMQNQNHAQ